MLLVLGLLLAQPVPDPLRAPEAPAPLLPPRLIEPVVAEYPPGRAGAVRVVLQLDVDVQGKPANLSVLTPPQPGFDEAALAAAQKLRFEPAMQGGKPVAVRI